MLCQVVYYMPNLDDVVRKSHSPSNGPLLPYHGAMHDWPKMLKLLDQICIGLRASLFIEST